MFLPRKSVFVLSTNTYRKHDASRTVAARKLFRPTAHWHKLLMKSELATSQIFEHTAHPFPREASIDAERHRGCFRLATVLAGVSNRNEVAVQAAGRDSSTHHQN